MLFRVVGTAAIFATVWTLAGTFFGAIMTALVVVAAVRSGWCCCRVNTAAARAAVLRMMELPSGADWHTAVWARVWDRAEHVLAALDAGEAAEALPSLQQLAFFLVVLLVLVVVMLLLLLLLLLPLLQLLCAMFF